MAILTPARSSEVARTALLAIERAAGGHAICELRQGARIAPRILHRGAEAVRAAFVPTRAGPLAGDSDSTRIVVGPGATLVVEPIAATLALPGPERTFLRLDVTLCEGARLVLDEGPLIVAAGADVERRCTIALDRGAVAAVRETAILGRDGEQAGPLDSALRATLDGRPLLYDGLRVAAGRADDHVALAPGHRVAATACLLGARPSDPESGALALEGPGALVRATGATSAATDAAIAHAWASWAARALKRGPGASAAATLHHVCRS